MKILEKTELSQFTTMKVGGIAERICFPTSIDELVILMDKLFLTEVPLLLRTYNQV